MRLGSRAFIDHGISRERARIVSGKPCRGVDRQADAYEYDARQNDREKRLRERKQKARPERLSFIWIRLANGMASLRLAEGAQSSPARRRLFAVSMSAAVLCLCPYSVHAQNCFNLTRNIDVAGMDLRRARDASDFDSAKHHLHSATEGLQDAQAAANDCNCTEAASEFEEALAYARRARDANSEVDVAANLNRTLRYFNAGLEMLRGCRR